MLTEFDIPRLERCYRQVCAALLAERNAQGHWEGELSSSALATATAIMALEMVRRFRSHKLPACEAAPAGSAEPASKAACGYELRDGLIERGLRWIAAHQNADGGWGDTTMSVSNISTTMLCHATLHAAGVGEERGRKGEGERGRTADGQFDSVIAAAQAYIDRAGGATAVRARYGKDKTFSIPILTHCALAGLVDWKEVSPLPFELACVPANFYKWLRLPVVSYALPALIAIGQARHHFRKPRNPLVRWVRNAAIEPSLRVLERIQPTSGGFLEATPLTSFVTMSLAAIGRADHPVTRKAVEFIARSVRPDGSWPIDTNLATWVTTLSINALGDDLPPDAVGPLREWLLGQQYREVHPYTNTDPGGWAWTDLPGSVPDADDTPGAILALRMLARARGEFGTLQCGPVAPRPAAGRGATRPQKVTAATLGDEDAIWCGVRWLLDLQNRDGGWPTFCHGWGTLPFDRSAPDLTAHSVRALNFVNPYWSSGMPIPRDDSVRILVWASHRDLFFKITPAIHRGLRYLSRTQRLDGSWLPLWFGNQYVTNDENPTYGTARVLAAYRDLGIPNDPAAQRGLAWLRRTQNTDGGWGGAPAIISSIEETALALDALLAAETDPASLSEPCRRGLEWLLGRVDQRISMDASPIGFYFAKLWYFEKLYPLIFTVAALGRATRLLRPAVDRG